MSLISVSRSPMAELCRRRYSSRLVHLGLPNPWNNAVQQDVNREGKGGREEGSSGLERPSPSPDLPRR